MREERAPEFRHERIGVPASRQDTAVVIGQLFVEAWTPRRDGEPNHEISARHQSLRRDREVLPYLRKIVEQIGHGILIECFEQLPFLTISEPAIAIDDRELDCLIPNVRIDQWRAGSSEAFVLSSARQARATGDCTRTPTPVDMRAVGQAGSRRLLLDTLLQPFR